MVSLKVPSSNGVSAGPNITAFHCMILLSHGAPLTPAGGSSCDMKAKNPYSSDSCNGIVKNDTERKKNCYKSFKS